MKHLTPEEFNDLMERHEYEMSGEYKAMALWLISKMEINGPLERIATHLRGIPSKEPSIRILERPLNFQENTGRSFMCISRDGLYMVCQWPLTNVLR